MEIESRDAGLFVRCFVTLRADSRPSRSRRAWIETELVEQGEELYRVARLDRGGPRLRKRINLKNREVPTA